MSDKPATRKLTLEIDVPADQMPENATGRLSHRNPKKGETFIGIDGGVWLCDESLSLGLYQHRLVIETREPWKVPEHLRHGSFRGAIIKNPQVGDVLYCAGPYTQPLIVDGFLTMFGVLLRVSPSDFDGVEPGKVYKLGEAAE